MRMAAAGAYLTGSVAMQMVVPVMMLMSTSVLMHLVVMVVAIVSGPVLM